MTTPKCDKTGIFTIRQEAHSMFESLYPTTKRRFHGNGSETKVRCFFGRP